MLAGFHFDVAFGQTRRSNRSVDAKIFEPQSSGRVFGEFDSIASFFPAADSDEAARL